MAPKWNKKKDDSAPPPPTSNDGEHHHHLKDAVLSAMSVFASEGDDMANIALDLVKLKQQDEFTPRQWPKSPRGGASPSGQVEEPQFTPQEGSKTTRQKGWNKAPKNQPEQDSEKTPANTDDAVAPTAKAARAKGWQKNKTQGSDTPPGNSEGVSEEGKAKGFKSKKAATDAPSEGAKETAKETGEVAAKSKARAKGWQKSKKDDAQDEGSEQGQTPSTTSETAGESAKPGAKKGFKKKKEEPAAQEDPAPPVSEDTSPEGGKKAKAKAKWGSKSDKAEPSDVASDIKARASHVPSLNLSALRADDEEDPISPTTPGMSPTTPGVGVDFQDVNWRKTILVTPPTETPPKERTESQISKEQTTGANQDGQLQTGSRKANTFYYGVLVNTDLQTCIEKGKWDCQPWKVDKSGAPTKGDKRVFDQELPGLGKVYGVEVCTGYYRNDNEYFHSYALIESSHCSCTPFLGTLHMLRNVENPKQVFIKFRATWESGELTLDNQKMLKTTIDSYGDESAIQRSDLQSLEAALLGNVSPRASWASRLKAAAQEVDTIAPDGQSEQVLGQGVLGDTNVSGPDVALSDLGTLLDSSQAIDFAALVSPAQKRWADLRTIVKMERNNFYDSIIRSDLKDVLQSIDEDELCEVRSYTRPPLLVEHVLANVQCLLGLPEDWDSIRRNMRPTTRYLQQLMEFNHTCITLRDLQQMRRRAKKYPASFKPHIVETISFACAALCRWVNVMCWRAGEQNWFHEDVDLLAEVDKEMISELASFIRPPVIVVAVLGNVHILLGLDDSWPKIQSHLKSASIFLQRLQYFDQTTLTQDVKEIMKERHRLYPHSFIPDLVQPVNSACAKLCKWVNAVCLRAGLDFTSESMFRSRGKLGYPGFSTYGMDATIHDTTANSRFAHEETSGWIECIHPDSKFIRPEDHTKTLEQLFNPKQGLASGMETPSQLQLGAAKWFLDPSGERNFRYAQPAAHRYVRTRSTPAFDNGRTRSPQRTGVGNRQSRSPSARGPSVSPRYQGGGANSSPRSHVQPPQAKVKPSQPMARLRNKDSKSQSQPKLRAQSAVQAAPRSRSAQRNTTDQKNTAGNVKPATNSTSRVRASSRSRNESNQRTTFSEVSTATPSTSSSFSPFTGETYEGKHPDSHLLSTLGGPAVVSTIAGVLKRPPKNPELVAFVLGNVHCLLGLDPDWERVLESLKGFQQFLDKLRNLDQNSITPSILGVLRQRQEQRPDAFSPLSVTPVSHACATFVRWVNAVMARAAKASSQDLSASVSQGTSLQKGVVGALANDSLEGVCETDQPKASEAEQSDTHLMERDGKTGAPSSRNN